MKYWLLADLHLGHDKLVTEGLRKKGFEDLILKSIKNLIQSDDVLICLGDFCIGNDLYWHNKFFNATLSARAVWLIRGNHDNKSASWYLNHGWDFVADNISMKIHGVNIMFSHRPILCEPPLINIHGHLHKDKHRNDSTEENNILIYTDDVYKPVDLRDVLEGKTEYCENLVRKQP